MVKKDDNEISRQVQHAAARIILAILAGAAILYFAYNLYQSNEDVRYLERESQRRSY